MTELELELAEIAASGLGVRHRAESLLDCLRERVPFDAAWMALADTQHPRYTAVASIDVGASVNEYFDGPVMAADIEATGTNRRQPPLSPSDLSYPRSELLTWSECLTPAGVNEALAVALFEPGGRHVGFLALLYGASTPPPADHRMSMARAASVMAAAMDPVRTLTSAARLVEGAAAGAVLLADGEVEALPGLTVDPLLRAGTALLELARADIRAGHTYTTFLWPIRPDRLDHLRVTVIAANGTEPTMRAGLVVLSRPPDMHGLTPRELEVLGYVVRGCPNQEIARQLVLAPRTVAAHLEHILVKLQAPTRTSAAVRAYREGLYVPVSA